MKLLLDTHAFVWWDSEPDKLSPAALAACLDPANELLVSVASLWEMQIKRQLGKLALRMPIADIIAHQQATNAIVVLPVEMTHVLALDEIPSPHRDPFDRLLVAQAIREAAPVVTADRAFAGYPVRVVW